MSTTTSTGTTTAKKSLRRLVLLKFAVGSACVVGGTLGPLVGTPPLLQLPDPARDKSANRPSDDTLTLQVQQALADDPQLQPYKLNLLVNVLDGVAVIGGPVPREGLTGHVEAAARRVSGIQSVRASVWVSSVGSSDPFTRMVGDKVGDPAPPRPAPRPTERPQVLLSLPGETRPAPAPPLADPGSVLLDPVVSVSATDRSPPARPPGAAPLPYETIPPTLLPTVPVREDTAWAVEPKAVQTSRGEPIEELKRDTRFARLTVELRNGVATIGGRARKYADVWDFADELRKLSAVNRVIVGGVDVR